MIEDMQAHNLAPHTQTAHLQYVSQFARHFRKSPELLGPTEFGELSVAFFDTTSLYFEGRGGATLGQRGFSKDFRPQLHQVVLGIVLDGPRSSDRLVPLARQYRRCHHAAAGRLSVCARGSVSPGPASLPIAA